MLLGYDKHRELQSYVRDLNHFYRDTPALWQVDYSWEGFQWIVPDDSKQSVIAFLRRDAAGKMVLVVCNFNPVLRKEYQMGVPNPGSYKEILNSDDKKYGGSGVTNGTVKSKKGPMHGFDQHISPDAAAAVHPLSERARCPQAARRQGGEQGSGKARQARQARRQKDGKNHCQDCGPCRRRRDRGGSQAPRTSAQGQNDGVSRLWIYVKNGILPKF